MIESAVYKLCVEANTVLTDSVFSAIFSAYKNETNLNAKGALKLILINAKMAYETKKPLCQDTGQVLVFVKIGEKVQVENLNQSISEGVLKAYSENFYRKSVVKNALFNRENTKTNVPCIIYPKIVEGDELEIEVLIKGAGAENMSAISMLSPTASEDEIVEFVKSVVEKAGAKACPPLFIGVGIGGTIEYAGLLSKKALLDDSNLMLSGRNARPTLQVDSFVEEHKLLAQKIKNSINELKIGTAGLGGDFTALDVKVLTDFTHIASMPVAVSINCHSSRHSKCVIKNNEIKYFAPTAVKDFEPEAEVFSDFVKIDSSDVNGLRALKQGQNVLLSGEIFTARDMAHKKLVEIIKNGGKLPFDLKNKIIFYAGPCPCASGGVIGSVGPTTSTRMDKFAPILYEAGILATIGKGERSGEVLKTVKQVDGLYFTVIGGIACYLSGKVIENEVIAFEELGTEAICRLVVCDLPLRVDYC